MPASSSRAVWPISSSAYERARIVRSPLARPWAAAPIAPISASSARRTAMVIAREAAIDRTITTGISTAIRRKSSAASRDACSDSACSRRDSSARRCATTANARSALTIALALIDWSMRAISMTSRTAGTYCAQAARACST